MDVTTLSESSSYKTTVGVVTSKVYVILSVPTYGFPAKSVADTVTL